MNKAQIIELLKKLQKFELTNSNRAYDASSFMEKDKYGDYVKFADVCKLFGIECDVNNQIKE